MKKYLPTIPMERIERAIFLIRGQRVLLDGDLAKLYGVRVKVLTQAVKRNRKRFPDDFVFQLSWKEARSSRSQFVTLKQGENIKYRPYAFTEHGAVMAANILRSEQAVKMSIFVVRAFIRMRAFLSERQDLALQLKKLESKLTRRLDVHEMAIVDVLRRLIALLEPSAESGPSEKPKGPIGFQL